MKILLLGCGGLGSEILKNLVMINEDDKLFDSITVIDLDTIELTNLNRQLLFQTNDIGQFKSIVAAKYLNGRSNEAKKGFEIIPLVQDILTLSKSFINQFDICISALDSIEPRRYINNLICQIAIESNCDNLIPFWDCGSEQLSGQIKLVIPGITACWECSSSTLLDDGLNKLPICTIINQPRNMNHIVQYFMEQDNDLLNDNERLYDACLERAKLFKIDYSKFDTHVMQDIINRTVPSVVTTNSMISSECCNKILQFIMNLESTSSSSTGSSMITNNFITINGNHKQYQYYFQFNRREDCHVCSDLFQKGHPDI